MAGYSDKDERATPGGYSPNDAPAPKPAGVIRRLADMTAVPFAQGVVGVPEIAVGADRKSVV